MWSCYQVTSPCAFDSIMVMEWGGRNPELTYGVTHLKRGELEVKQREKLLVRDKCC